MIKEIKRSCENCDLMHKENGFKCNRKFIPYFSIENNSISSGCQNWEAITKKESD